MLLSETIHFWPFGNTEEDWELKTLFLHAKMVLFLSVSVTMVSRIRETKSGSPGTSPSHDFWWAGSPRVSLNCFWLSVWLSSSHAISVTLFILSSLFLFFITFFSPLLSSFVPPPSIPSSIHSSIYPSLVYLPCLSVSEPLWNVKGHLHSSHMPRLLPTFVQMSVINLKGEEDRGIRCIHIVAVDSRPDVHDFQLINND